MKTAQRPSQTPTGGLSPLDPTARNDLNKLAPHLTRLLAMKLPGLTAEYLQGLQEGLKAVIVIEHPPRNKKGGRARIERLPNWGVRKFCLEAIHQLLVQTLDRGGAPPAKETALSGEVGINATVHHALDRYRSMTEEERSAEIIRLERIVQLGLPPGHPENPIVQTSSSGRFPVVEDIVDAEAEPVRRREPVIEDPDPTEQSGSSE